MSITMPAIEIKFRQLASTFIQRSERGTAVLIIKDDTEGAGFVKYTDAGILYRRQYALHNRRPKF